MSNKKHAEDNTHQPRQYNSSLGSDVPPAQHHMGENQARATVQQWAEGSITDNGSTRAVLTVALQALKDGSGGGAAGGALMPTPQDADVTFRALAIAIADDLGITLE